MKKLFVLFTIIGAFGFGLNAQNHGMLGKHKHQTPEQRAQNRLMN